VAGLVLKPVLRFHNRGWRKKEMNEKIAKKVVVDGQEISLNGNEIY
jgi:hypothetical protein